jgi:sorbitol-specific phosphotransferase system component IIA
MTSPETSYTKNVTNELSFLLVAHTTCFDIRFHCYVILKSGSISGQILDRLGHKCLIRFLGHNEGEICWSLNTKTVCNQLSFLTPTQIHIFYNRSNSYGCLSTTHMRGLVGH